MFRKGKLALSVTPVVKWYWSAILSSLVTLTGCGGGVHLVEVTGKVLVDGKPANGAILLFHPESSENTNVPTAIADASGLFAPITDDKAGIQEGSYRVTVSWPDPNHKTVERFGVEASDPKDLLKGKYITRDKSNLTVTITRSSKELEPFELTTR